MLRDAAERTGAAVGDGTTTATILAHAIVAEGPRNIAAGASAIDLKRGLDRAARAVVASLRLQSRPVRSEREKQQPATVSVHNGANHRRAGGARHREGRRRGRRRGGRGQGNRNNPQPAPPRTALAARIHAGRRRIVRAGDITAAGHHGQCAPGRVWRLLSWCRRYVMAPAVQPEQSTEPCRWPTREELEEQFRHARRAVTHARRSTGNLAAGTVSTVRRHPLRSVGAVMSAGAVAGSAVGLFVGFFMRRRRRRGW
jgi:hypothetical protein